MSTPEEVQEPKSKVPPMPPTLADRELAEAICRELFPEFCTGLSDDLCEFANRATVVSKHIAAHCAAATAKERQAREALQTQLDEAIASAAESMKRAETALAECRKERDEARELLEQAERTNQLHWLHEYEKVNEVLAKVMVTLGTTETALAASQSALAEAKRDGEEAVGETQRAGLWAAHLSLHLNDVRRSVEAFVRGVQLTTWKTNEPRVIGFKIEFDAMVSKIAEKEPELPPRDALRTALAASQARVEAGERRFPGFSLHENPPRVQRLGFAWLDQKGQHRYFEMAITDNYPLMVANQLKQLAEGIEEAHWDPKSPLARAALAPAPAGGKP